MVCLLGLFIVYPMDKLSDLTHLCVKNITIIVSDNGSSPGRRQAIIRTNARILLMESLGTNVSEILIGVQTFSFKKMHLKMSSANWRPFCLGLKVLTWWCELSMWLQWVKLHVWLLDYRQVIPHRRRLCWYRIFHSLLAQPYSGTQIAFY